MAIKATLKSKEDCLELVYAEKPDLRNDEEVQKNLKYGVNDVLNYLPDGLFGREWDLKRVITSEADETGDVGDCVVGEDGWVVPANFITSTREVADKLLIEFNEKTSIFEILQGDKHLCLTPSEFWQIVRFGDNYDTKQEVEEYLRQLKTDADYKICGVPVEKFSSKIDTIVKKVIENRTSEENGDQIYSVLEELARNMKVGA